MFKQIFFLSLATLILSTTTANADSVASSSSEAAPLPACQCSVDIYQGAYTPQLAQANVNDVNTYLTFFKWKQIPGQNGCYQMSCDTGPDVNAGAENLAGGAVLADFVKQLNAGDPLAVSTIRQFGPQRDKQIINSYLHAHGADSASAAPVCQTYLSADGRRLFVGPAHIVKYPAKSYYCRKLAASSK